MLAPVPDDVRDDVIALRRDLHRHPELGYDVTTGIGVTGVVGVLRGPRAGKTIMLRADMDALALEEENAVAYASQTRGTMHACGHDGHVAMLLGGAQAMLDDGLFERFGIERAYGLHLASAFPTGVVGVREGPFYASSDSIEITIEGAGGHAAAPHRSIDPIYVAGAFIVAVQQIVARQIDPLEPAVVTIGAVHAGTTHNVIPSRATLLGTVRAFDAGVRAELAERIERVLRGVCESSGATYTLSYLWCYPITSNDAQQTRYVRGLAERELGAERVVNAPQLMGAEDFSFFAERVPACFYSVGCNGGPASAFPHHHAKFDIDERALETGVAMMTALALDAPERAP